MAIRTIRTEGDEILRKKSKKVEVIDEKIKELIQDMIETLHKYDGVGLAAVQVGILKQIVIIQEAADKPIYVIINPEIISQSGVQVVEEGCLSFPNKFAKIERPEKIKIRAMDENGKVFIDKMIPGTLEIVKPEK